jgi:predicted Zn-dependent protease
VRIAPRDPVVWHELAKIRLQQNKLDMAISLAKKSNALIENDNNLLRNNWILIAKSYELAGNAELARQARINANRLY